MIGEVARDFGLYTKITGGQRIDLFGARVEQLPAIWQRLVDAGFESGHAYGKSLRTVKSCVGSTWCRYGVQDSVGARHRPRAALPRAARRRTSSSSASRAAPASAPRRAARTSASSPPSKGWNLYVGGNGGMTPAPRRSCSPRTSTTRRWSATSTASSCSTSAPPTGCSARRRGSSELEGGLDAPRAPSSCDDSLGIGADLEAGDGAPRRRLRSDEWKAALDDPEKLPAFVSFVNAPEEPDPTVVFDESGPRKVPVLLGLPTIRENV